MADTLETLNQSAPEGYTYQSTPYGYQLYAAGVTPNWLSDISKYNPSDPNLYENRFGVPGSSGTITPGITLSSSYSNLTDPNAPDYYLNDPSFKFLNGRFNDIKAQLDSLGLSIINSIHSQYANLIAEQKQINYSTERARNTSLLLSGSSRYAQLSSESIMHQQISYGLGQIARIQAMENEAIAKAQDAILDKNMRLAEAQTDLAESFRKEKMDYLKTFKEKMEETDKKIQFNKGQNNVSQIISDGETDPGKILKKLQEMGSKDFTLKDINDTIDQLNPDAKEIYNLQKEAAKNGANEEQIATIGKSKTLDEALAKSSGFLQDPTSNAGQWKTAVEKAIARGETPPSYQDWVSAKVYTDEVNKEKAKALFKDPSELTPAKLSRVTSLAGDLKTEQTVKDYQIVAQTLDAVRESSTSATDDIQRIYAFAKIMDPNSVVREGEYKTIEDYAQALYSRLGIKTARVFDDIGFLTQEARDKMLKTLEGRFSTLERAYQGVVGSYADTINKITGGSDGKDYLIDYSLKPANTEITIQQADQKLSEFITADTKNEQMVEALQKQFPEKDIFWILKQLGITL